MSRVRTLAPLLVPIAVLIGAGVAGRLSIPAASPPRPLTDRSLQAITCPAPGQCIAVGLTGSTETVLAPLTADLDQGTWTVHPRPINLRLGDAFPSAVACRSSTSCIAVGQLAINAPYLGARATGNRPLAQIWDGRTWRRTAPAVPAHAGDAALQGIACSESVCMAVGEYAGRLQDNNRALAETWEGGRWTLNVPPVVRPSGPGSAPDQAVLLDVACTSPRSCTAVGQLTFEVNGQAGSTVQPLIERWDGSRWHVGPAVMPGSSQAELNAVACPSPGRCMAVGSLILGAPRTLAELSVNGRWQVVPTPDPPGVSGGDLKDVSCPASNRCVAVGDGIAAGRETPLVGTWNGHRWTFQPLATPRAFTASTFNSVDCPTVATCDAVGNYEAGSPAVHSFSATLVNGGWTLHPVPGT